MPSLALRLCQAVRCFISQQECWACHGPLLTQALQEDVFLGHAPVGARPLDSWIMHIR